MSSLAVPEALFTSLLTVCVWPAGTGTADPPLTPGGVYRALEEAEGRVECVWGPSPSLRNIPFRTESRGHAQLTAVQN